MVCNPFPERGKEQEKRTESTLEKRAKRKSEKYNNSRIRRGFLFAWNQGKTPRGR